MNILSIASSTSSNLEWLKGIGALVGRGTGGSSGNESGGSSGSSLDLGSGFWGLGFSLMHVGFEDLVKMMQTYFGVVERFCLHISEHYLLAKLDRFPRSKDDTCRNLT